MTQPKHQKPTFTELQKKTEKVRKHISKVQQSLNAVDTALDELKDCISVFEEILA